MKKIKNLFLIIVFILVLLHFVKDLTQDILGIETILSRFGNIQEDISNFPLWFDYLWKWAMVNTVIAEMFILYLIPKYFIKKLGRIEIKVLAICIIYIPVMFICAYALS